MNKRISILVFIAFLLGFLPCVNSLSLPLKPEKDDIMIIGNRGLPFDSLTKNQLKNIYLGKLTYFGNVTKINFTLLSGGKTHSFFIWKYFKKRPLQYRRYWKKLVFSGKGRLPMSFRTERDLRSHVALTKGTIGYISKKTKPIGVKIIKITE